MEPTVTNIVIAGLGGQGVLKASDILSDVIFAAGLEIKKSEVHGMAQRGGSVASDVRFGPRVWSPMVPPGEADYLLVIAADQVEVTRCNLRPGGILIEPALIGEENLRNKKAMNVALLGALSTFLPFPEESWHTAIAASLPEKLHAVNMEAFAQGRAAAAALAAPHP